jgi:hypothetical protein
MPYAAWMAQLGSGVVDGDRGIGNRRAGIPRIHALPVVSKEHGLGMSHDGGRFAGPSVKCEVVRHKGMPTGIVGVSIRRAGLYPCKLPVPIPSHRGRGASTARAASNQVANRAEMGIRRRRRALAFVPSTGPKLSPIASQAIRRATSGRSPPKSSRATHGVNLGERSWVASIKARASPAVRIPGAFSSRIRANAESTVSSPDNLGGRTRRRRNPSLIGNSSGWRAGNRSSQGALQ